MKINKILFAIPINLYRKKCLEEDPEENSNSPPKESVQNGQGTSNRWFFGSSYSERQARKEGACEADRNRYLKCMIDTLGSTLKCRPLFNQWQTCRKKV